MAPSIIQLMHTPAPFLRLLLLPIILSLDACWLTRPHELFPLEVGSSWTYQVGDKAALAENTITTSLIIGTTTWYLYQEFGEKFWIRNGPEGQLEAVNLYNKGENAAIFEKLDAKSVREELVFRFPANPGESWITLENEIRYEGLRKMDVPAGTFNCHYYSITQYGQTYSHTCIAEQVGIVFSDRQLPDGNWETSTLLRWKLPAPSHTDHH